LCYVPISPVSATVATGADELPARIPMSVSNDALGPGKESYDSARWIEALSRIYETRA